MTTLSYDLMAGISTGVLELDTDTFDVIVTPEVARWCKDTLSAPPRWSLGQERGRVVHRATFATAADRVAFYLKWA